MSFRGAGSIKFVSFILFLFANNEDPDQMPRLYGV